MWRVVKMNAKGFSDLIISNSKCPYRQRRLVARREIRATAIKFHVDVVVVVTAADLKATYNQYGL